MWHTVLNISPDSDAVFSDIAANAVVRDVNINANSHIYAPSFRSIGILAGSNHGLIVNTFTSGGNLGADQWCRRVDRRTGRR